MPASPRAHLRERQSVRVITKSKEDAPGMAESIVDIFADHGFTVRGGRWRNSISCHIFQVSPKLARQLIAIPAQEGRAAFEHDVTRYRECVQASIRKDVARRACATL